MGFRGSNGGWGFGEMMKGAGAGAEVEGDTGGECGGGGGGGECEALHCLLCCRNREKCDVMMMKKCDRDLNDERECVCVLGWERSGDYNERGVIVDVLSVQIPFFKYKYLQHW